jgi:hypothetical protein
VIKFDGASGAELWRQVINGSLNDFDQADAVTVDAAGDVIAAGFTRNTAAGFREFTVLKFEGVNGSELWRKLVQGSVSNPFDEARAVTVDTNGDVVAAGFIRNADTAEDFTVVKLEGATGAEVWRQTINGSFNSRDEAAAVGVDDVGDVVAGGFITNTGAFRDFTVIKFEGVSGNELWRQVINGSANGSDEVHGIAVDSAGDVIAAGRTENAGTLVDFTVVKLRKENGSDF